MALYDTLIFMPLPTKITIAFEFSARNQQVPAAAHGLCVDVLCTREGDCVCAQALK